MTPQCVWLALALGACGAPDPAECGPGTVEVDGVCQVVEGPDTDAELPTGHTGLPPVDDDGDGYVAETSGGTDCDDADPTVYPGAEEVPYDGVDQDCDGADMLDADEDGVDGLGPLGFDCDDTDPSVYPGASDPPYDGVDQDCGLDSDFDADGDGYDAADFGGRDCDDADPAISPGAMQQLGDTVDRDCDGIVTAAFSFGALTWLRPRAPRVLRAADQYVVLAAADELWDAALTRPDQGVALAFPVASGSDPPFTLTVWQGANNPQPLGLGLDAALEGDGYRAGIGYLNTANEWSYGVMRAVAWDALSYGWVPLDLAYAGIPFDHGSADVDVVLAGDGTPWMVQCGGSHVHVLRATSSIPSEAAYLELAGPVDVCFFEAAPAGDTAVVVGCTAGSGCARLDADLGSPALALSSSQPYGTLALAAGDLKGDLLVRTLTTGGLRLDGPQGSWQVLDGEVLVAADAQWLGQELMVLAVARRAAADVLLLAHGDPGLGPLAVQELGIDPERPALQPTGASLWVDADRLVLAVSAVQPSGDDAVGWALYAVP